MSCIKIAEEPKLKHRNQPGHCFRPFQHSVYLIEVQITEQRRNDSPNAKDNGSSEESVGEFRLGKLAK